MNLTFFWVLVQLNIYWHPWNTKYPKYTNEEDTVPTAEPLETGSKSLPCPADHSRSQAVGSGHWVVYNSQECTGGRVRDRKPRLWEDGLDRRSGRTLQKTRKRGQCVVGGLWIVSSVCQECWRVNRRSTEPKPTLHRSLGRPQKSSSTDIWENNRTPIFLVF